MIFYLKENKRKKRKVYLKESSIMLLTESNNSKAARNNRIFLFEGNSSRAARQTRDVIAQYYNLSPDAQNVAEMERQFRAKYFSEGRGDDWFISLEPTAYKWFLESGPYKDYLITILIILHTEAQNSNNRTAFMQNAKTMTFNQVGNLVGEYERGYRATARQNKANGVPTENPKFNPRYGKPLGPLSFNESKEYGQYSGLDAGKGGGCICYTTNTGMREQYSNSEENSLFLLLRDDWKTVNTTHDGSEANNGLGDPYDKINGYDDYGLSMIFVWITPDGEMAYSNTRWNHKAEYVTSNVDQAFNVPTLEKLMGAKFEEAFEVENFYDKYADPAHEAFINGKPIEEVFDGVERINDDYALVKLGSKWNIFILSENKLYFPRWMNGNNCWVREQNDYGDLVITISQSGIKYYFADGQLIDREKYLCVIADRLKNGADIGEMSEYCRYEKLNSAGDLCVSDLVGPDVIYFDGEKFYEDAYDYINTINNRLEKGCDPKTLFSTIYVHKTKTSEYYIVSFDLLDETKYGTLVDNKLNVDLFDEYNTINDNNDLVVYDYNYGEWSYFSEGRPFGRDDYLSLIRQRLADGLYSPKELFHYIKVSEKNENLVIVGIDGFTGNNSWDDIGYNIIDLEKGDFEFRGWYDSINFVNIGQQDNELAKKCLWVETYDEDYSETLYYLYVDNKFIDSFSDIKNNMIGNAFIVQNEDGYYNLYGLNEYGDLDYLLEDYADDIIVPNYVQGSCKYAVIEYENDDSLYYLPIINSVVNEDAFAKYINEEFEDGFGPGDFDVNWEELGNIAKIRIGGDSKNFILVDLRNKPYRMMFDKILYGEIREIPNTELYIFDVWDDDYRDMIQNVMDSNGNLLIKEDDEKAREIKIPSGGTKIFFTVRYPSGYNILDIHGNYVFKEVKTYITRFINGYCVVNEGNFDERKYFIYNEHLKKINKWPFRMFNVDNFENGYRKVPCWNDEFTGYFLPSDGSFESTT